MKWFTVSEAVDLIYPVNILGKGLARRLNFGRAQYYEFKNICHMSTTHRYFYENYISTKST